MRTRGRFPNKRRKSPLSRECWVPSSAPIYSTFGDIKTLETGIASIGGAGTFDGIVLSGIVAAYLA